MDWVKRLNESINYIEDNLAGEISYEQYRELQDVLFITIKECFLILQTNHYPSI